MSAAWTVFFTVLGGVVVFVVGQIVQRFVLEPIQEQRRVIGEVAFVLLYHGNVGRFTLRETRDNEAWESRDEIAATLRRLAGELRTTRVTIPAYRVLEKTPWVRKTDEVLKASTGLVGWSNALLDAKESRTAESNAAEHKDTLVESLRILR